jgi:hypothetical protein
VLKWHQASACAGFLLNSGGQVGFQPFPIQDRDFAAVHFDEALCLKPRQVSRNQFADSSDLSSEFLMTGIQLEHDSPAGSTPIAARLAQNPRDQTMPHGRERKLLDDPDQSAQSSADHLQ